MSVYTLEHILKLLFVICLLVLHLLNLRTVLYCSSQAAWYRMRLIL